VLRVYRLPEVQERMRTLGLDAQLSTPEQLATYQAAEIGKWSDVVRKSGARAE
jgi:tripartite-type tricarboxylate transporter receptor subunit TctC